ncbi:MAG: DUF4831 family protein, partial [Prevotella sp.]|nr:DUF4831 family protein [Prevotella sp.]
KHYTLTLDKRFTISQVERMDNGILLAINSDAPAVEKPASFIPARKVPVPDPKNYMNEDILTAGSSAKMAELIAQEIYDIRESRNLLSRGQAEFMPKDGEQLRIMMNGLNIQEQALMQVFDGLTVKDTTEVVISFIPSEPVDHQLFFRFSKWEGFTDVDDLSGTPYYISVTGDIKKEEENSTKETKKPKNDIGLRVNMPTKAKVTVFDEEKEMKSYELFLGQFGETEILSGDLFGKKQTTKMTINPVTGGLESIREQPISN